LHSEDYTLWWSGAAALARVGEQAYGLVLMDCQMPDEDAQNRAATIW